MTHARKIISSVAFIILATCLKRQRKGGRWVGILRLFKMENLLVHQVRRGDRQAAQFCTGCNCRYTSQWRRRFRRRRAVAIAVWLRTPLFLEPAVGALLDRKMSLR
ncbi:MAG TPA: hypothetical protein VK559_00485 [Ferruginibacter sp.]|nr:hypothetical protein [Ferruginibacter sp.]